MIELATTIITMVASAGLFVCWFRYACLLMLTAQTTRDYTAKVTVAHQLSFLQVESELREGTTADLDRMQAALNRDFAVVTNIIGKAAGLEDRMLQINY